MTPDSSAADRPDASPFEAFREGAFRPSPVATVGTLLVAVAVTLGAISRVDAELIATLPRGALMRASRDNEALVTQAAMQIRLGPVQPRAWRSSAPPRSCTRCPRDPSCKTS